MGDVPIRSIAVSDFRRLSGTRTLPLDAPIVLLHGPNGSGKTSILSALELGLTGHIRSMQRQDPRYTAHLPFLGQDFATIRVEVADSFRSGQALSPPLTVGGSRIEGLPALTREAANFYGERCYLDQASLGRLLELYQHRDGKEESALARFVNELLGLEQLDELRAGLQDANDFRSLKKLADRLGEAAYAAERATVELAESTSRLAEVEADVEERRAAARAAALSLELSPSEVASNEESDEGLVKAIRRAAASDQTAVDLDRLVTLQRDLIALGGRIDAAFTRPSADRLRDERGRLEQADQELRLWSERHSAETRAWQRAAHELGVAFDVDGDVSTNVESALSQIQRQLDAQAALRARQASAQNAIDAERRRLQAVQNRLMSAQDHATALVEGLASIRVAIDSEVCPVCDRDYSELKSGRLGVHVDIKLAEISQRGQDLLDLRREQEEVVAKIARAETEVATIQAAILSPSEMRSLEQRRGDVARLREAWQGLKPIVEVVHRLRAAHAEARGAVEELEAASGEEQFARAELARIADALGRPEMSVTQPVRAIWAELSLVTAAMVDERSRSAEACTYAVETAEQLHQALKLRAGAIARVAVAAQRKGLWEASVKEGQRRQAVARAVFDAASAARGAIVQRVFTQSLNEVWRSVFTRLAPSEGFIPAFGIPSSTKAGLELTLRTIHRGGAEGGPPQMMLSAGNLNTAALSLFLALHLAVEPILPCLVFDDPVQAMDEVHVAQFAGLIRVLARQHQRQVIIAVHERELYEYLAFELSPAFEGDELLTIELGEGTLGKDLDVTRHKWSPDRAIAG